MGEGNKASFQRLKKKKINHKQNTEKLYFGMNHAIQSIITLI